MLQMAMAAARRGGLRSAHPELRIRAMSWRRTRCRRRRHQRWCLSRGGGTGRAVSGDDGSVGLAAAAPAVSDAAVALIELQAALIEWQRH